MLTLQSAQKLADKLFVRGEFIDRLEKTLSGVTWDKAQAREYIAHLLVELDGKDPNDFIADTNYEKGFVFRSVLITAEHIDNINDKGWDILTDLVVKFVVSQERDQFADADEA